MAILLVGYSLPKHGNFYSDVERFLQDRKVIRINETSFAIETDDSPLTFREKLKPYVKNDESLIVIHLSVNPNDRVG